jgi:hypothetical protein
MKADPASFFDCTIDGPDEEVEGVSEKEPVFRSSQSPNSKTSVKPSEQSAKSSSQPASLKVADIPKEAGEQAHRPADKNAASKIVLPPQVATSSSSSPTKPPTSSLMYDEDTVMKLIATQTTLSATGDSDNTSSSGIKMSIQDLGGQRVFYTIHHLFLRPYGINLLVFNMRMLCGDASDSDKTEALEFLRFWLNILAVRTCVLSR